MPAMLHELIRKLIKVMATALKYLHMKIIL